jgi:D-alanyl-D-alanine carboxypeptidase
VALGREDRESSPGQQPAPITSLAKVMTAYLVLRSKLADQVSSVS